MKTAFEFVKLTLNLRAADCQQCRFARFLASRWRTLCVIRTQRGPAETGVPSRQRLGSMIAVPDATPFIGQAKAELCAFNKAARAVVFLADGVSAYHDARRGGYEIGLPSVVKDDERERFGGCADDLAVGGSPSVGQDDVVAVKALLERRTTDHQGTRAVQQIAVPIGEEAPHGGNRHKRRYSASAAVEGKDVVAAQVTLVETLGVRLGRSSAEEQDDAGFEETMETWRCHGGSPRRWVSSAPALGDLTGARRLDITV